MRLDLGPVTLDTDRHQVFRGAEPAHLSTKAFQLLELLVDNRPRALSKEELQKALWPDTFVSDTSLTTLVNEIRALLSENARGSAGSSAPCTATATRSRAPPRPRRLPAVAWSGASEKCRSTRGRTSWDATRRPAAPSRTRPSPAATPGSRCAAARPRSRTSQSKNGTFVGDERVTGPVALADGDAVRLGLVRLVFREPPGSLSTTKTVK